MSSKRGLLAMACAVALPLCSVGTASGASIFESESNGAFGTADGVSSGVHQVYGEIGDGTFAGVNDVDIFSFGVAANSVFSASVLDKHTMVGVFDISMVLMDSTGMSWAGNDGADGSINVLLENAGTYYLAVTAYQNHAVDFVGNPIQDWPGLTFDHWTEQAFGAGHYTLQVSSVVPLPAAAWLLLSGIGALSATGLRRKAIVA